MKLSVVMKYTLFGVLFGFMFPLIASLWLLISNSYTFSLHNLLMLQKIFPLLWMIDSAPCFLGLFALVAGKRQAKVLTLNDELTSRLNEFGEVSNQLKKLKLRLEKDVEKQIRELKATAHIAREAASIHHLDKLLEDTVNLISKQFSFYHAGIFLIDEQSEYAVLCAASSEGGKKMLAHNHKLLVGKVGIVGHVAASGVPRIALDVDTDSTFYDNPYLPETRSEVALPLISRQRIIGVLDVQSLELNQFSDDDVAILQTLADQIALAIDNARLFTETQRALKELETLNRQLVVQAWRPRLARQTYAYRYDHLGVKPLQEGEQVIQGENGRYSIELPILLRGQSIGSIRLTRDMDQVQWSPQEKELFKTIVSQLGLALENLRILEDVQRKAEREKLVAEITARLWASSDIRTIVRVAAQEIGSKLGVSKAEIQLEVPDMSKSNLSTDTSIN